MDTANEKKPVVLVVDDDELAAKAVSRVIERQGYTVLSAYSGRQGIELLGKHAVDVLVLDVMMPQMTGLEVRAVDVTVTEVARHEGVER